MADSERMTVEGVEPVEFAVEKEKALFVAQPLVTEKLYKKLEKIMKAAIQIHACSRGVKEVTKTLRKKQKGCDAFGERSLSTKQSMMQVLFDRGRLHTDRCDCAFARLLRRPIDSLCLHSHTPRASPKG